MPAQHYWTAADVLALPEDGNRYEVVHGELLVSPSPRLWHQIVLHRLSHAIEAYLARNPVAVGAAGGDLSWSDDSLVVPDLVVLSLDEARTLSWAEVKRPLLVVEVLSPSNARQDRFTKRRLYQEVGIPAYWVVDPDAHVVEVWTPEVHFPVTEHGAVRWHPTGAPEPLVIPLAELFRAV